MKISKNLALSESGFAFNGSTGDSFILNETASFILQKIKEGLSEQEILNLLLNEYEVNPMQAEKDLHDFITQLKIFNLLED
ncbi:MAG: PqqD family protein [Ignavibacteria bacterium]